MATADDRPIIGDEDVVSQTSTELYDEHEPFETFQHKVIGLCHELWPSHDEKDFAINRMRGGSDNRVVGIKISSKSNYVEASIPIGDYVLRIPRRKEENFDHTRAILQLAGLYLKPSAIKVLAVVHFDKNMTNALRQPYILQNRLRGSRLDKLWDSLNKFQREQIAFELGRLYWSLQSATNSSGGIPDLNISRTRSTIFAMVISSLATSWSKSSMNVSPPSLESLIGTQLISLRQLLHLRLLLGYG